MLLAYQLCVCTFGGRSWDTFSEVLGAPGLFCKERGRMHAPNFRILYELHFWYYFAEEPVFKEPSQNLEKRSGQGVGASSETSVKHTNNVYSSNVKKRQRRWNVSTLNIIVNISFLLPPESERLNHPLAYFILNLLVRFSLVEWDNETIT